MSATAAITMKNISFRYGEKKILEGFNLDIMPGKTYCLVGSSGSGKTTTLRLINGLLKPNSGDVFIDGKRFDFSQGERWRRSMGYSIQGSGLFPHMTLEENLSIIAQKEKWQKKEVTKRIHELCELMSLPTDEIFLKKKPRQISGGQQQRVGIARALFMKPSIMLMDEPFSALDPITRSELQKEFLDLQERLKITIVLVTHDLPEAFSMADEIILLNQGQVEQKSRPSRFLLKPESPYVEDFMRSHSPGNLLKEIYLYSVINPDIFVCQKKEEGLTTKNLDSGREEIFKNLEDLKNYLQTIGQSSIYWCDENNQFKSFQEFSKENVGPENFQYLESSQHILTGMQKILNDKVTALPVVNKRNEIIGVFSEGALNAL